MTDLPEPLKVVLRDFCHVEWYEVGELSEAISNGVTKFDAKLFKNQLNELLASNSAPIQEINTLTGNEFESIEELRAWLTEIQYQVFGISHSF